jgi:hypothetical protein
MKLLAAILLALLQPPAPVLIGATFTSSTTAAITWQQPPGVGLTCLHRYYGAADPAALCRNDLPAGPTRIDLPGALGPFYRPAWGDRYVLSFEGVDVGRTTLGEVPNVYTAYLSLVRGGVGEARRGIHLPLVMR